MSRLILVAAPYCYGPTSKLLCVADELVRDHDLIYVGAEPGISLAKNGPFTEVISITDRDNWNSTARRALRDSSLLVTFLDYRAVRLAAEHSIPSVFFDTLCWQRDALPPFTDSTMGYLVQAFFCDIPTSLVQNLPQLQQVGPVLPLHFDTTSKCPNKDRANSILVNFGGLRSPAMVDGADVAYLTWVTEILALSTVDPRRLIFCLPIYLKPYADMVRNRLPGATILLPMPSDFYDHLTRCSLLLTVPGLEVVFEAMHLGIPMIFLPPHNGTQSLQLAHYMRLEIALLSLVQDPNPTIEQSNDLTRLTTAVQTHNIHTAKKNLSTKGLSAILSHTVEHFRISSEITSSLILHNRRLLADLGMNGRIMAARAITTLSDRSS